MRRSGRVFAGGAGVGLPARHWAILLRDRGGSPEPSAGVGISARGSSAGVPRLFVRAGPELLLAGHPGTFVRVQLQPQIRVVRGGPFVVSGRIPLFSLE